MRKSLAVLVVAVGLASALLGPANAGAIEPQDSTRSSSTEGGSPCEVWIRPTWPPQGPFVDCSGS